jgi:hypothetical protein
MSLYQIVYTSRNEIQGDPERVEAEIISILAVSRENNQRKSITGALLFNGSIFAQVLEGSLADIEQTYEHIQCDPRHSDVVLLSNAAANERAFSDWSMAYADPAKVIASPELKIDFEDAWSGGQSAGPHIVSMLRALVVRGSE